jgi:hypothetical protein
MRSAFDQAELILKKPLDFIPDNLNNGRTVFKKKRGDL